MRSISRMKCNDEKKKSKESILSLTSQVNSRVFIPFCALSPHASSEAAIYKKIPIRSL